MTKRKVVMKRTAVTKRKTASKRGAATKRKVPTKKVSKISKYLLSSFMPKKLTLAIDKESYK